MIIFKINEDVEDTRSFFKRLSRNKYNKITKEYETINNIPFDIITLCYKDFENDNIKRLLNVSKGQIMESFDSRINELTSECLFDKSPYFKRALLSSIISFIKQSGKQINVAVIDDSFSVCVEYYELCNVVKGLTIVTGNITPNQHFVNEIYYNYGLKINTRKKVNEACFDVIIDFLNIENDQLAFKAFCDEYKLIPDKKYYEPDDSVLRLIDLGVPLKCACAVIRGTE